MKRCIPTLLVVFFGPLAAAAVPVRFLAFGDSGDGTPAQFAVAQAMSQVCRERGCDLALMLGDNFYPVGVTGTDDPQWQEKFEKPYAALDLPFYATLGNHDNGDRGGDGAANARGDVQTRYRSPARAHGPRWMMRDRIYSFDWPPTDPLATFLSLDSSPLTAVASDPNSQWDVARYAPKQRARVEQLLAGAGTPWRIAFAHHPYRSNGGHGNAGTFDGVPAERAGTANGGPWKELIERTVCGQRVDLLLAGHDHDLELLEPAPPCGRTWLIVSGAAARPRAFGDAKRNPAAWQAERSLGFFWVQLESERFTVAAYTLAPDLKLPRDAGGLARPAFERVLPKPYRDERRK